VLSTADYKEIGFGAKKHVIKFKQGFKELIYNVIEDSYKKSKKRLIIID